MEENKTSLGFAIVGLFLVISGVITNIFSENSYSFWTLCGSGLAIIWLSFYRSWSRSFY